MSSAGVYQYQRHEHRAGGDSGKHEGGGAEARSRHIEPLSKHAGRKPLGEIVGWLGALNAAKEHLESFDTLSLIST